MPEAETVRICRALSALGFVMCGSTGTVLAGAGRWLDAHPDARGSVSVAVAPDRGERYLASLYDDDWVAERFGEHLVPAHHASEPVAPAAAAVYPPIGASVTTIPTPRPTVLPLTAAQLTLWFDETYMDDFGLHTMGDCLEMRGPIDIDRLLHTLQLTMNEADVVRARYRLADNRPVQELAEHVDIPVSTFAFAPGLSAEDRLTQAWQDMNDRMDRRMDIARPPLVYVVLYPIAPEHLLILTAMHHIVADGYSRTAIYDRWRELYDGGPDAGSPLPPLTTLLDAEAAYRAGPSFASDERHWRREVATLPDRVSLSVGGSEPGRTRLRVTATLGPAESLRLRERAERAGSNWSATLIASSLLYIAKFTGRDHVQATFPVTARTSRAVRRAPGMMANYPPLAARVEPGDTVETFVRAVGKAILRTIKHQRYRVQSIRALAGIHQSDHVAFGPYLNVIPQEPVLRFGDAEVTLRNLSTGAVDDLMFTFMDAADGGLDIHVNGNPALHSAAQVEAHATRLVGFLRRALSDLSVAVADIPLLVEGDPAVAADAGPAGLLDVPGVVEAVHRVAAEDPARIAIRDDEGDVGYLELALLADAIARRLRPGTVAAVLAAPGRHFVAALVAALQAGAVWTPIDVDSPPERKLTLIGDSGASVVLATGEYLSEAHELASATGASTVVPLDGLPQPLPEGGVGALAVHPADPEAVAYIMFTSGTTGRPKGAMVHRAGLLNHLLAKAELLELGDDDVVMQNAPVTFDVSIWQMLAPLLRGGATRPVTRSTAGNPSAIAEIVVSAGLTHLELVPTFLRVALEYFDAAGARPFDALKTLMVTGEALPVDVCAAVHDRYPSLPIVNAYGPTECSDDVAHAVLTAGGELGLRAPIGVPIRNTRLLVLGHDLLPVPDGVVGELYVAGACVGPGYLDDPVKTARAFTALPGLAPGQRAYRTGDHVVRNARGELEFVERRDHQVKINGQRIELGEVEAGLRQLAGVADAAASVVQTGGAARLAGHLVLQDARPADLDEAVANLRNELAGRVSAHLVPSLWSVMEVLPLTTHGKVDRKALPDGAQLRPASASGHEIVRASGPAGGDSASGEAVGEIGLDSPPGPDAGGPDAGEAAAVAVPLVPTPIQRQLADEAGDPAGPMRGYCQFVRLSAPAGLAASDVDLLMTRLTQAHPMLSVRLDREHDGGWHLSQRPFGVNGWTSPSQGHPHADLAKACAALDLERGIVWRAVLDADAGTLQLAIHHLAVDGVSWRILQSDLARLAAGGEPQPERTAFRDWAADQLEAAHHPLAADRDRRLWTADRWQPTVRIPGGAATWADSRVHTARLGADAVSAFLTSAETAYGVHINDLLLAALGLALAAEPGLVDGAGTASRIDVEVEGHGREDLSALLADGRVHDLGRTVGWFTTNYPVSVHVPAPGDRSDARVRSLVHDVRAQTSAMAAHGLTHGLSRWLDARSSVALARRPIPSIGFNYLGRFREDLASDGPFALLPATAEGEAIGTAAGGALPLRHRLEITLVVWDTPAGPRLVTSWRYDATAVAADRVERLAAAWHDTLAAVVAAGEWQHPAPEEGSRFSGGQDVHCADARDADAHGADAREHWRAHLFGLRRGAALGAESADPARIESLAIDLGADPVASRADRLAAPWAALRPFVHMAWAAVLAEHAGVGEAVVGAEFMPTTPGGDRDEHPARSPHRLLPLRVRLRPGEDAAGLVARIGEEHRVLESAAELTLAEVLDAVPDLVPGRVLDSAVLVRESAEPGARGVISADPEHPAGVLDLVAMPREGRACAFALHVDAARMTREEARAHGVRFVAALATLLDGRLPAAFVAAPDAGARIRVRPWADPAPAANSDAAPPPVSAGAIAAAMARVLGRSEVGPDDGFFALGGDSISVISLVSELRAGGHEVEVRDIYRHRTPRELADASVATDRGGPVASPASAASDDDTGENLLRLDDDELAALEAELGF